MENYEIPFFLTIFFLQVIMAPPIRGLIQTASARHQQRTTRLVDWRLLTDFTAIMVHIMNLL